MGDKLIEVKCPYSITKSNISPSNYSHIEIKESRALILKRSSSYWRQVQAQMFYCDKVECDFVVCTKVGMEVISVPADREAFCSEALPKLLSRPQVVCGLLGLSRADWKLPRRGRNVYYIPAQ